MLILGWVWEMTLALIIYDITNTLEAYCNITSCESLDISLFSRPFALISPNLFHATKAPVKTKMLVYIISHRIYAYAVLSIEREVMNTTKRETGCSFWPTWTGYAWVFCHKRPGSKTLFLWIPAAHLHSYDTPSCVVHCNSWIFHKSS